jgi:hypothetical protein
MRSGGKKLLARQQKYESQNPQLRVGEARGNCNPDPLCPLAKLAPDQVARVSDFVEKTYPNSTMGEFTVRPEMGENASAYKRTEPGSRLSPAKPAEGEQK